MDVLSGVLEDRVMEIKERQMMRQCALFVSSSPLLLFSSSQNFSSSPFRR
ncbi:MAG: hypothetical protein JSS81_15700 [Acidobacteria bacterium]|nr:hypothetical protein [Acidobacteriota bacterium]